MSDRVQKEAAAYVDALVNNFKEIDKILEELMGGDMKPKREPTEEEFDELMYLEKLQVDLGNEMLTLYDTDAVLMAIKGSKFEKDIFDILFVPLRGLDAIN